MLRATARCARASPRTGLPRCARRRRGSRAPGRAAPAQGRSTARRAPAAPRRVGGGARRCAGTCTPRRAGSASSSRDVAGVGELGDGVQRGRHPERGVGPAVDELEQLDRELDVTDAAAAPLDLAVGVSALRGGPARLAPSCHGAGGDRRHRTPVPRPEPQRRRRNASCRSARPATGLALRSAWNSHGCAHASQYASRRQACGRADRRGPRAGGRRRPGSSGGRSRGPDARRPRRRRSHRRRRSS